MNLFILDESPKLAAEYHCDKHVVKMILEVAQLLSTAHHVLGISDSITAENIYKPTHKNHPCSVWVRENQQNYRFALDLLGYLCEEYTLRYGKYHAVETKGILAALGYLPKDISLSLERTAFAQCMPDQYKKVSTVQAYRDYYIGEKAYFAKWKEPRNIPFWFVR